MNDSIETYIEPELEARIAAYVLDESWEHDADALEQLIASRPELETFRSRLIEVHTMLNEATQPPSEQRENDDWKLSPTRRESLKETFRKAPTSPQPSRRKTKTVSRISQRNIALTAAACLALCIVIFATMQPMSKLATAERFTPEIVTYSAAPEENDSDKKFGIAQNETERRSRSLSPPRPRPAEPKPVSPSSSMARVIASNTTAPSSVVPVPSVNIPIPSDDFGDGFGASFGGEKADEKNRITQKPTYPTEGESPELPDSIGGKSRLPAVGRIFPVTPGTTPHTGGSKIDPFSRELDEEIDEFKKQNGIWPGAGAIVGYAQPEAVYGYVGSEDFLHYSDAKQGGLREDLSLGGLRSGDFATTRNSIDAILNNPNRNALEGKYAWVVEDDSNKITENFLRGKDIEEQRHRSGISGEETEELENGTHFNSRGVLVREHARRGAGVRDADRALTNGRKMYSEKNYASAARSYREALAKLPPGSALDARRKAYKAHLADANIALAQQARRVGKVKEARKLLTEAALLDSENPQIANQLQYLDDPIRTSPALNYQHSVLVDQVRKNLYRSQGYYNLGQFEKAKNEAIAVLAKDKYNKAARRMLEKIAVAKSDYFKAAYDDSRAELLRDVDSAWELTTPAKPQAGEQASTPKLVQSPAPPAKLSKLAEMKKNLRTKSDQVTEARKKLMDAAERAGIVWMEREVGGRAQGSLPSYNELAQKQLYEAEKESESTQKEIQKLLQNENPTAKQVAQRKILKQRLEVIDGRVAKMREILDSQKGKGTRRASNLQELNTAREQYQKLSAERDRLLVEYDKKRIETIKKGGAVPPLGKPIAEKPATTPLPKETLTHRQPFSTFSLNVSDVSFKLAKVALLEKGQRPDAAKIRTEEFVNAFDYGDPAPQRGEPVACSIEQSVHPFLQQRNLLRIGMKTAASGRSQPLRLTILLDNSGSMERDDREESVIAAMKVLAAQLQPQDVVTLISFARQPRLLADRISGAKAADLISLVQNTPSEGGTNLEEALALSNKIALRQLAPSAQNRVVLITDGVANLGNTVPQQLAKRIESMRQQGIAFDACGVGADGLNDDILEALTRKGDGRYYFLDRPEDADSGFAKQLAGALNPAAKNVKVQVVFNPKRVSRYRLLGFEKHRLKKEDFRNDQVDAAEMTAAEAGNAVYQIQVNPSGQGDVGQVYIRFRDLATGQMVERSWTIPYEPQASPLDRTAPSMQLAATAAMLGEKLHNTDAGSVRFNMLTKTLSQLRAHYQHNTKVQDLIRMCEKVNR